MMNYIGVAVTPESSGSADLRSLQHSCHMQRNRFHFNYSGRQSADKNNYKKLSNERENYTKIKDTWEEKSQFFNTLKVRIPSRENSKGPNSYIETLDIIFRVAEDNNISIDKINPVLINTFPEIVVANKKLDQTIYRYTVAIECNGDFFSLGRFFEELQNHKRMVNLLKFNIETEYGSAGGLFCEVILNTYLISKDN